MNSVLHTCQSHLSSIRMEGHFTLVWAKSCYWTQIGRKIGCSVQTGPLIALVTTASWVLMQKLLMESQPVPNINDFYGSEHKRTRETGCIFCSLTTRTELMSIVISTIRLLDEALAHHMTLIHIKPRLILWPIRKHICRNRHTNPAFPSRLDHVPKTLPLSGYYTRTHGLFSVF